MKKINTIRQLADKHFREMVNFFGGVLDEDALHSIDLYYQPRIEELYCQWENNEYKHKVRKTR